jgi:peptidoglycan/xylan/chitin deacetylase (PgdA/CDA1 family)
MRTQKSKLNVLHVLSQYELTGAETYAVSLAEYQKSQGYSVWFVSDLLSTPTEIALLNAPISQRSLWQRLKNIYTVRRFLIKNEIDILHAHSRAASWVCFFARLFLKIPLISTVHGKQHLHLSSQKFNIYGDHVIAICENLKTHIVQDLNMSDQQVDVIRNPFRFQLEAKARLQNSNERDVISLIGRASNNKGDRACALLEKVFSRLLTDFPHLKVRLVGGELGAFKKHNQLIIQHFIKNFAGRFEVVGFVQDLKPIFESSDLVIAAGRTAIEAIDCGTEVFAFGEGGAHGIVSRTNLETCLKSNFGDCLVKAADPNEFENAFEDLTQYLRLAKALPSADVRSRVRNEFDVKNIHLKIEDIYLKYRMKKIFRNSIPILMYHRVVDSPPRTRHQTFVLKEVFEQQLKSLKLRKYTSLSFEDYEKLRHKEIRTQDFPKRPIFITFDDAYVDNLKNALPLLQKYNFKASLFCLSDHSIQNNFWDEKDGETSAIMNEAQKIEAARSGHFEIASHGISHRRLTELSAEQLDIEVQKSKIDLEKIAGQKVEAFAYPFGAANAEVRAAVQKAGYHFAVLTDKGGQHFEDDLFSIFRINMFPNDRGLKFWRKTQTWYRRWYDYSRKTNRPS